MVAAAFLRIVAACLVLVWPALGSAHQGTGAHGGLVTDAGPYYLELILNENQLRVFVFDDKTDGAVHTAEASATATVLAGQEKQDVTLRPGPPGTDDNVMVGQLEKTADAVTRIVVLIRFPGKPSIIARFAL
jgi:hypothetical protein